MEKKLHYSTREIANIVNCSQTHVSRIIRKYEKQIDIKNGNECVNTINLPETIKHEELVPTPQPRMKLQPNLTPIYDRSKYTHDTYGFPIKIEDYKIYYPSLYEEHFNFDNNHDENN